MSQPPFAQQPGQTTYPPYQQPGQPPQYQPQYGPPQYTPAPMMPQQGPGFGWGPGGPGWGQQPPKKKSKAPIFVLLGFVVLAVIGIGAWALSQSSAEPHSSPRYTPSPTRTQPTEQPTGQPTNSPSEKPSAATVAARNKLYSVGRMATVNCKEPRVRPTNTRNAAAYWAALKPCLDKSWAPLVTKAGYTFKSPRMTYWSGSTITNPCGGGVINVPFFCSANNMLYMKVDVFVKTYNEYPDAESKAYARMWYSRSIAHEYGHSVQYMTGILQAASQMRYDASDYAGQLRMTRRMELQANCFAGVFLAANKSSYPINGMMLYVWRKWVVTAGDDPEEGDHGSKASQARFMGKSFNTGNPATCNTFAAPAKNVS
ncbi:neutral zinc metallopeptidase [Kribbella antiqua]|uniref:neutral zinc metallopeptidase n=1 Tax=Kribbella antiqua TaxID=2512217 RepID=UPI001043C7EA|nr:neutral zinc metallopeptidase [Kribbella antiqua]